jgi:hypothetical protein
MIETFALLFILTIALLYVIRHIRRTLIVGEDDKNCQNCPAKKLTTKVSKKAQRFNII